MLYPHLAPMLPSGDSTYFLQQGSAMRRCGDIASFKDLKRWGPSIIGWNYTLLRGNQAKRFNEQGTVGFRKEVYDGVMDDGHDSGRLYVDIQT